MPYHLKNIVNKSSFNGLQTKSSEINDFTESVKYKQDPEIEFFEKLNQLEIFLLEISNHPSFKDKKLNIYLDKIDEIWSDHENSHNLVSGLLSGAYDINSKFSNVKCISFLRPDIYQSLNFKNKEYLKQEELEINWTLDDLKELIFKRIEGSIEREAIETLVFSGEINGQPLLNYMIDRTTLRPRDLIQFCTEALELAKTNKKESITKEEVFQAEAIYSKWKIEDLISEYKDEYSFLKQLLTFGKELGFRNISFSREMFMDNFFRMKHTFLVQYPFLEALDYELLLEILFNINLTLLKPKLRRNPKELN